VSFLSEASFIRHFSFLIVLQGLQKFLGVMFGALLLHLSTPCLKNTTLAVGPVIVGALLLPWATALLAVCGWAAGTGFVFCGTVKLWQHEGFHYENSRHIADFLYVSPHVAHGFGLSLLAVSGLIWHGKRGLPLATLTAVAWRYYRRIRILS